MQLKAEATIQLLQLLLEKVLSVPAMNTRFEYSWLNTRSTSGASIQPQWSDHAPEPGSKNTPQPACVFQM